MIVAEVLEGELNGGMNGDAKAAWKHGIRAMVAGVSKNLK